MNNNPFKPSDPKIPGVSSRDESAYHAPPPSAEQKPVAARFSMSQMPPRWLILSATGVVAVCLIAVWWMHGTSAKEANTESETTTPATTAADSKPAPIPSRCLWDRVKLRQRANWRKIGRQRNLFSAIRSPHEKCRQWWCIFPVECTGDFLSSSRMDHARWNS